MFNSYPNVVFIGKHPFSDGYVTTMCKPCNLSLASFVFPDSAQRVLIDSFGISRLSAMNDRFGTSCQMLGIFEPSQNCIFAMLFSAETRVRRIWANCLKRLKCKPDFVISPERVLIDFIAVPRQNSRSIMHYVFLALDYLRFCGYLSITTECQELRHLIFWMRKSVNLLNPPPFSPFDRAREISSHMALQSGEVAKTIPCILDGEKLFTVDGRWRLYLKDPIYFTYDIHDDTFIQEKEDALGTKECLLRPALSCVINR